MLRGIIIIFILFITGLISNNVFAQENEQNLQDLEVRVFLDCNSCNNSYIRDEVQFVNFVRDKEDAHVHLLITRERTGAGTEFKIQVIGRGIFLGQDKTLSYVSFNSDTDEEERRGLVRYIRAALFPYVSATNAINEIDILYTPVEESTTEVTEDTWNSWIFELDSRISLDGEESRKSMDYSGGFSANRTTKKVKTDVGYEYEYDRRTFSDINSEGNEEESVFIRRSHELEASHVWALTNHWSAGVFSDVRNSTRNNFDLSVMGSTGIEYNIFPYEEYSEREISFVYMLGAEYRNYTETTIYLKDEETLLGQELRGRIDFTQTWGGVSGRANFRTFMHDLSRNRFEIDMDVNFRIFRGLELSLSGRYSIINDQLNIPAGNISDAEQLLNLREQFTSYSYGAFIGLEYTFGSIFNQAINPRF
ncbi:MAG: hypothetical protein MK198_02240 [Gracilimonas sp.]|uniref:hypothetical protein n=1 Tax=Gracilimonas sp. TaxID=1974203 RepID=UPI00374FF4B0|nr:hypothetical protein [Gracilimonas sp.]